MLKTITRFVSLVLLLVVHPAYGVPSPETWERWLPHDPDSMHRVDNSAWETFLLLHLRIGQDGTHRIAYGEVSDSGRAMLDGYVRSLAAVPIASFNRAEQMAYWINFYNALTIQVVLDHYPVASIRDIDLTPTRRGTGPWDKKLIEVGGIPISLNDIENRILRPIWRDPRVHYATSCASISCPNLQPEPFQGDRLERQLTEVAMAYINDPRCIEMDGQRLKVASIFRWYAADFGGSDRGVISHLMAYAEPKLAMTLQGFDRIDGDFFDWGLNDANL